MLHAVGDGVKTVLGGAAGLNLVVYGFVLLLDEVMAGLIPGRIIPHGTPARLGRDPRVI